MRTLQSMGLDLCRNGGSVCRRRGILLAAPEPLDVQLRKSYGLFKFCLEEFKQPKLLNRRQDLRIVFVLVKVIFGFARDGKIYPGIAEDKLLFGQRIHESPIFPQQRDSIAILARCVGAPHPTLSERHRHFPR